MSKASSTPEGRALRALFVGLLGLVLASTQASVTQAQSILQNKLIYKAPVDECFYGYGNPKNTPAGFQSPCPAGAQPKVNGAYIWGMTETVGPTGQYIWFGTVNDYLCQVMQTLFAATGSTAQPFKTSSYVCEFNQSQFPTAWSSGSPPPGNFDWRQPQIYRYNVNSPASAPVMATVANGMLTQPMATDLSHTQGLRSAGSTDQIVFLGGPSGAANPPPNPPGAGPALFPSSITLFAFTPNGTPKGSKVLPYTDIRKWVFVNGNLYAGVQAPDATGRVLHWVGTPANPFSGGPNNNGFEEVGVTDAEVANLATLNGRLYATTWGGFNGPAVRGRCPTNPVSPGANNPQCLTGFWVSPPFHSTANYGTALAPSDATGWVETFNVGQYEPDPGTAFSLVGGAVEPYNGQIYWGTMQVPLTGYITHCRAVGAQDPNGCGANATTAGALAALILTVRPTAIFRNNGSATSPVTESLYGAAKLPAYQVTGPTSGTWTLADNKLNGVAPTFGPIGFGNPFNAYTWSGAVYQNRLYFGTFDWSYLAWDALPSLAAVAGLNPTTGPLSASNLQPLINNYPTTPPTSDLWWTWAQTNTFIQVLKNNNTGLAFGADLWRFDSPSVAAKAESINGLGNPLNYGIRSLVSDLSQLWPGTANPMNLKATPGQPMGGWEFRAMTGQPVF
jgi:hypothetical protein